MAAIFRRAARLPRRASSPLGWASTRSWPPPHRPLLAWGSRNPRSSAGPWRSGRAARRSGHRPAGSALTHPGEERSPTSTHHRATRPAPRPRISRAPAHVPKQAVLRAQRAGPIRAACTQRCRLGPARRGLRSRNYATREKRDVSKPPRSLSSSRGRIRRVRRGTSGYVRLTGAGPGRNARASQHHLHTEPDRLLWHQMQYSSLLAAAAGGAAAFADVAAAGRAHLGAAGQAQRGVRSAALLRLDQLGGAVRLVRLGRPG